MREDVCGSSSPAPVLPKALAEDATELEHLKQSWFSLAGTVNTVFRALEESRPKTSVPQYRSVPVVDTATEEPPRGGTAALTVLKNAAGSLVSSSSGAFYAQFEHLLTFHHHLDALCNDAKMGLSTLRHQHESLCAVKDILVQEELEDCVMRRVPILLQQFSYALTTLLTRRRSALQSAITDTHHAWEVLATSVRDKVRDVVGKHQEATHTLTTQLQALIAAKEKEYSRVDTSLSGWNAMDPELDRARCRLEEISHDMETLHQRLRTLQKSQEGFEWRVLEMTHFLSQEAHNLPRTLESRKTSRSSSTSSLLCAEELTKRGRR